MRRRLRKIGGTKGDKVPSEKTATAPRVGIIK